MVVGMDVYGVVKMKRNHLGIEEITKSNPHQLLPRCLRNINLAISVYQFPLCDEILLPIIMFINEQR